MRLRPGHSSPNAFVRLASKRTPAFLLGRLGKSKGPRLRPNIGMRFEVPLGSIAARALAHLTSQAVASPAQPRKYEERLSNVSVRIRLSSALPGDNVKGLGRGRGGRPGGTPSSKLLGAIADFW